MVSRQIAVRGLITTWYHFNAEPRSVAHGVRVFTDRMAATSTASSPYSFERMCAERQNLNIRMGNRRMTWLTNALQQESREPRAHDVPLFHALQFRSHPSDPSRDRPPLWETSDKVTLLEAWKAPR